MGANVAALFARRGVDLAAYVYGKRAVAAAPGEGGDEGEEEGGDSEGSEEGDDEDFFKPIKRKSEVEQANDLEAQDGGWGRGCESDMGCVGGGAPKSFINRPDTQSPSTSTPLNTVQHPFHPSLQLAPPLSSPPPHPAVQPWTRAACCWGGRRWRRGRTMLRWRPSVTGGCMSGGLRG